MSKVILSISAIYGFLSVSAGAFGGHALKDQLTPKLLDVFEVAVRYAFYHTIVLLIIGFALTQFNSRCLRVSAGLFAIGIFVFSGSLLCLVFTEIKTFGAVTPIGGLLFLAGWTSLLLSAIKGELK